MTAYKKQGFTLVELLAVIVVLGIILAIAIPNIIHLINNARNDAYLRQNDLILDAAGKYVLQNEKNITWTNDTTTIYLRDLQNSNLLDNPLKDPRGGNYNNTVPNGTRITVTRNNNQYSYTLIAVGGNDTTPPILTLTGSSTISINQGDTYTDPGATATDDTDGDITNKIVVTNDINTSVAGTYTVTYNVTDNAGNNTTITRTVNVVSTGYLASKGVNRPRLVTGMTPIKWNGSAWVDTTIDDTAWYNYTTSDKQWANARTQDGSMWVWIPRYAYQIATNYHVGTASTINIKFVKDDSYVTSDNINTFTGGTYSGNSQTNYILHPAFTFGGTELTGIWVAKFEPSGTSTAIDIKPNATSLGNLNVSNMFTAARNMETNNKYGWGTTGTGIDTHMMKNIEWGAVAYITQSSYGKNAEVWKNNSISLTTGCAGDSVTALNYNGCQYAYNTANGMQASTTGNIYGIYDMSGGAWEYTASYVNNGNVNLTNNALNLLNADPKYKDIYTVTTDTNTNNYNNAAAAKKGDAVYETSSLYEGANAWYGDYSGMPTGSAPIFIRGDSYGAGASAGLFNFTPEGGGSYSAYSFRVVLMIGA